MVNRVTGVSLERDAHTSARLSRVRQRNTAPEVAVRQVLHRLGLRFRVKNTDLPGSPDIANRAARWAVFVHGCFWHHHEGCSRATVPKRNRAFWVEKFRANRARDERACRELRAMGFIVLVVWECESRAGLVAAKVKLALRVGRPLESDPARHG